METVIGIVVGLLVLMALVVAHELGHFLLARRNGVKVLEFGIGFPPRARAWVLNPAYQKWQKGGKSGPRPQKWLKLARQDWGKSQKTLVFSLNWLPIGGFCAMDGESDSDTRPGTFGAAGFWAKTKILFGGVVANWLVAWVIFSVLAVTGMPNFMDNQFYMPGDTRIESGAIEISSVMADSPAERAGLLAGEEIILVNGQEFLYSSEIIEYNNQHAGEAVIYCVASSGSSECREVEVTLNDMAEEYRLGVTLSQASGAMSYSTWSAPVVGAINVIQLTGETYRGLWNALVDLGSGLIKQLSSDENIQAEGQAELATAGDAVTGPIGIIGFLFPNMVAAGGTYLAFLAALISVSLACMNVLPIPALDGGRWCLIALWRARGKKLERETEEKIVARAFMVLLFLIVLVTILDIVRFF